MKTVEITIKNDKYLFDQTIEIIETKKEIKILVGIGMLNSKDELSKNLPLDFLWILESLETIIKLLGEKNIQWYITVWFGDKNAEILLKEKEKFTEENKKYGSQRKKYIKRKLTRFL